MRYAIGKVYGETHEIITTFANTGREDPRTLDFIRECDARFNFNTIWLEAVFDPRLGVGTTHKIVDYSSALRGDALFETGIQKYGIPNKAFPWCTRELKQRPMDSYLRTLELPSFWTAIGIRSDEADRQSSSAEKEQWWYPLIKWGVTKEVVLRWWKEQEFDLNLPEHMGNCVTCWKKSDRKLFTLINQRLSWFAFCHRTEIEYPDHGAGDGNRRWWRGRRSTMQMIEAAMAFPKEKFFVDGNHGFDPEIDEGGACGDSCEVGADA